ncbi:hypothetical protein CTRI78_v011172 [Colletotrichum trifolii]|uniref:Uncharacterized protein n=1 Tax=Colletotrichum trifolii TaxID=5466 RepID=A0A4R8QED0_COLTR|nr:hypothetical protein CTRI78_v011172 [Colletotrichum trifolii]
MVRDAISALTNDLLIVHDLNLGDNGRQRQLVPFNSSWGEKFDTGFGGTSLVETNPDTATAAVFYLVNSAGLVGAGVAKVDVINGTPTVTQRFGDQGYWWPAHANTKYGDIVAVRDPRSDFIYAWGRPADNRFRMGGRQLRPSRACQS